MTGDQYTILAYVFASVLLLGYTIRLGWAFRSTPRPRGDGGGPS
jgi:hypothetical protein